MAPVPTLSTRARKAFVKGNYNFLSTVQKNLAERGIERSHSTVSRTWAGLSPHPNPDVVKELEAEYQRLTTGEDATPAKGLPASHPGPGPVAASPAPADVLTAMVPNAAPIDTRSEEAARVMDGQSAPSDAEMRYRAQIEKREEWLRKRRKKRDDDEAWLRARQQERARGETWTELRVQRQTELDERWLGEQKEKEQWPRADAKLKGAPVADFFLTLHEFALILAISDTTARKMLSDEPDVLNLADPGGRRAMIRVPVKVLQRIILRGSVPWPPRN